MALLKRRGAAAEAPVVEDTAVDDRGPGSGKGRPTPKRNEARAARATGQAFSGRGSSSRGGSGKGGKAGAREERRARTAEYRAAMASGDVSKLPPRERAPERVIARDFVDSRRNLGPFFLAVAVLYFLGALVPVAGIRFATTILMIAGIVAVVGDSVVLGILVTRKVNEAHPGTRVHVRAYSAQRALLPRRWRLPKPRVSRTS